jgi:two-component sensor histidine kinase
VHKEAATPSVAHFRLLSDAMEEFCSAQTQEEVVRISGTLAHKTCSADSISIVLSEGEQFHFAAGSRSADISLFIRSKVITRMSAWAIESAQTAVVPDVYQDERTRSHTNGPSTARSLVVVPVGGRKPFAAVTCAWSLEHWPAATEVLVLEALARATALALTFRRMPPDTTSDSDRPESVERWLGAAADAEGLLGGERRHWLDVAELQHRVRNVLGLVRSIVRRTSESTASAQDYSAHLEGRISALARTQAFVMRQPGAGVDIEELVHAELIAHAARENQVSSAGPPVRLQAKAAETLALALHELATNAVKYGALAMPGGRIRIAWRKEVEREDPHVRLEWVETGVEMEFRPPAHRGFGRDLIERTVPYELRGSSTLAFSPDGVRCAIDIPLTPDNIIAEQAAAAD